MNKIESINSICTTSKDILNSEEFLRWVSIILETISTFRKEHILPLFIKLQSWETLEHNEIEILNSFVLNSEVEKLWQKLLSKLIGISINIKANNNLELTNFSELLNSIFCEDGFKKVQSYILSVINNVDSTLETSPWFTKIEIKIDGENKKILLETDNFKVNSKDWEVTKIGGIRVKVNKEWDITEFLDWELKGEQLFTWQSANRESLKKWRKLPASAKELQAIIKKIWITEFIKKPVGYRYEDNSGFCNDNDSLFWTYSAGLEIAECLSFDSKNSGFWVEWFNKHYWLPVRCIKY